MTNTAHGRRVGSWTVPRRSGVYPPVTDRVLLLVAMGRPDDDIARQLGVETQAVRSLIDLAEAKLARLIDPLAARTPLVGRK